MSWYVCSIKRTFKLLESHTVCKLPTISGTLLKRGDKGLVLTWKKRYGILVNYIVLPD